jgi:serine/threonine protein kinase
VGGQDEDEDEDGDVTRKELRPMLGGARPRPPVEMRQARANLESRLFGTQQRPVNLGRYLLLDRIGAGGAGVVYAAYDPELERKVAIKLVHAEAAKQGGSGHTDRIVREAQALAQLNHPNVVGVYDVGTYDATELDGAGVFIVMELVHGSTLGAWIKAETRSWREVVEVFAAAGRGLAEAHRAGLVHRDFKPGNVILGEDGRVRVLDFGLARAAHSIEETPSGGPVPSSEPIPLGGMKLMPGVAVLAEPPIVWKI